MILDEKKALLQVEDLSVEFRTAEGVVHAVNHLSYSLREGEALGIVGESGSGKSTLLNHLNEELNIKTASDPQSAREDRKRTDSLRGQRSGGLY